MPCTRSIRPLNPLLRVYPGRIMADGFTSCATDFYAPPQWDRPDDEKPRHGRYNIWTVQDGRLNGIHVNAAAKHQAIQNAPLAQAQVFPSVTLALDHLARTCRDTHVDCQQRNARTQVQSYSDDDDYTDGSSSDPESASQDGPGYSCEWGPSQFVALPNLPRLMHARESCINGREPSKYSYLAVIRRENLPLHLTYDRHRSLRDFIQRQGGTILVAMSSQGTIVATSSKRRAPHLDDWRNQNYSMGAAMGGEGLGDDVWVVSAAAALRLHTDVIS
ncbi:hypothetical protein B0H13DRAFT_2375667 [Mycena leptocephala]|nr:hypothetical protein B0H13DRAFT_2375667 [Mycena leptocephala]